MIIILGSCIVCAETIFPPEEKAAFTAAIFYCIISNIKYSYFRLNKEMEFITIEIKVHTHKIFDIVGTISINAEKSS